MSDNELVLDSPINRMRVNDLHDGKGGIVVIIENAPIGRSSMMMTLDHGQQRLLQDRLSRSTPSPSTATAGDAPSGSRPPASAAMGLSVEGEAACDCQHPETTSDGFAAVSVSCPIHGDR